MCVAVPGEIISLEAEDLATVDFGGTHKSVSVALLETPRVGDFVIVHAGFALHRLDPEEARETLRMFREVLGEESP